MTGGCEVRDAEHARSLGSFGGSDDLPEVGSHFEADPCMDDGTLEVFERVNGRPCPRVELEPDNEIPAELFHAALHEQSRPYAQALEETLTAEMPQDRRAAVLRRAIHILTSERVVKLLAPSQALG